MHHVKVLPEFSYQVNPKIDMDTLGREVSIQEKHNTLHD